MFNLSNSDYCGRMPEQKIIGKDQHQNTTPGMRQASQPVRKRSYEEIISALLKRDINKSNAFFNLNLPVVDRFILTLIEDGVKTSNVILTRLKKENFNISFRSLQSHLEYLTRDNLIIRKRKDYGNEYEYFISNYEKALE